MARARNIKPSFFKNEQLVELPMATRLLFVGLWTLADREGRLEDRPKRIKMEIFPGDDVNVDRALSELHNHGFIQRYESKAGRCIEVINFAKHQNPHHKEAASTIPKPEIHTPMHDGEIQGSTPTSRRGKSRINGSSKGGRTVLIPDSRFSDSGLPNPESPSPSTSSAAARRPLNGEEAGRTVETWHAYAGAYQTRYGVPPTRNKTVNGQLAKFLERVPLTEAPDIAAFFVQSNRGLYVSAKHPVTLLLRDAEALRTEWLTGHQGTETEARLRDRTGATAAVFGEILKEAKEAH